VAIIVAGNKMYATCNYDGIPPPPFNRTPLTFEKGSAIDVYPNDGDFCEVSSAMFHFSCHCYLLIYAAHILLC